MRFEVYCDRAGGWRWRADARRAAHRVRAELRYGEPPTARVSAA